MTNTSYMVRDYPEPTYDPDIEPRECACGNPFDDDGAFLLGGEWVCAECFREYLESEMSLADIAVELGYRHCSREAAEYGDL